MAINKLIYEEQSAILANRSILDGPLIINELIAWLNKSNKKWLIFKVYIDKAYDSGYTTRGPALPFLIAMEGLSEMMKKARSIGLFRGLSRGYNGPYLSHFMYADDVIFIVFGTKVDDGELVDMANTLRCGVGGFPFCYLGLNVGGNMNLIKAWDPVVDLFKKRLLAQKPSVQRPDAQNVVVYMKRALFALFCALFGALFAPLLRFLYRVRLMYTKAMEPAP
ncbi:uncharacterized protein LOC143636861 [Bidens hawaiensis]|uniref:uncharacterized protein LOC143636861 n=1 Tax=Bidens hawaiensis TaxID=980011 RepID=UPI00404B86F2